ncbi:hypothetical protein [Streptomyces sp. NPDC093149]|uniref:hypothetical protein n=1 Tax=Streptomyces sp. NPDC093149 TaxID=3366031 RepID=UPI0037F4326C
MKVYDPAISVALSDAIGHGPPYSSSELTSVTDLAVKYSTDLSAVGSCTHLEIAIFIGCDPISFEIFNTLRTLKSLIIQDGGLRVLCGLGRLGAQKLAFPRNFIEDLSPLLELKQPCEIDVTGNPLSEDSYCNVLPELSRRGHRVKASGELLWKVTKRLHSEGVPVCCYRGRGPNEYRLCRPRTFLDCFAGL